MKTAAKVFYAISIPLSLYFLVILSIEFNQMAADLVFGLNSSSDSSLASSIVSSTTSEELVGTDLSGLYYGMGFGFLFIMMFPFFGYFIASIIFSIIGIYKLSNATSARKIRWVGIWNIIMGDPASIIAGILTICLKDEDLIKKEKRPEVGEDNPS